MTLPILTLTDGVRSLPLVYSVANEQKYKALYGGRITPPEPRPVWHTPDEYPRELNNLFDDIRTAFFEAVIGDEGTADDDLMLNDITTLRRWVDGADQQAARYHLFGDVNAIQLQVQRKDGTVKTIQPVIYGWVDDSEAHYDPYSTLNNVAYRVGIMLVLAPYGEAETPTTLYNYVRNAALYFESSTSGLAANWTEAGTPATTLDNTVFLMNGQSQKVVATTDNHGIYCDNISAASTSGYGYVWARVTSGSVTVELYDSTAAAIRQTKTLNSTDSGAVSDKTTKDDAGLTWYRVPLSSVAGLTSSNNHQIRILADGGAATCFVSHVYFDFTATSIPSMWSSQYSITNRGDQSTTNPERINWIDVWGVPGDASALVDFSIDGTITGSSGELMGLGTFRDAYDKYAAATSGNTGFWREGENLTTDSAKTVGGSWANAVVAAASAGNVARFTSSSGTNEGHKLLSVYSRVPLAVYARATASNTGATATLAATTNGGPSPLHDAQTASLSTTQYRMQRLGTVYRTQPEGMGSLSSAFNVVVSCALTTQTIDLDCVMMIPTRDGFLMFRSDNTNMGYIGANDLNIYGTEQRSWLDEEIVPIGDYPAAKSGNAVTRYYFNRIEDVAGTRHYLTDTFAVTLQVLPRTRHLLGTI